MTIYTVALLAGLFAAPAGLVWYGHRMRALAPRERAVFWGGVTGNTIAIVALTIVLLASPVQWHESGMRSMIVHWALLAGTLAGAVMGWTMNRLLPQ